MYERKGEWSGFTLRESAKGWIVERWSRIQGEWTNDGWLLPYGTCGISKGDDLARSWNPGMSLGDRLYEEYDTGKCLRKGWRVQ